MNILLALILCVMLLLAACAAPDTVSTAAGEFETNQDVMATIEDGRGNALAASRGNILLVVYLTPAKGNMITEDEACAYFYSGTKALVDGQIYDMKCISLEKVGGRVRYGLVFDIANNGYSEQNQPKDVSLSPPQSVPQKTPQPTATPIPTPVMPASSPIPAASVEVSPTASA